MRQDSLLATKFYVPRLWHNGVSRPRLLDRLDRVRHCGLALVSAPAGFGKTTLVSEWVQGVRAQGDAHPQLAWLSLDEADNDLPRFLGYLIAALASVAPQSVQETQPLLRLPQLPPIESVLTALVNELCSVPSDLILVLDDYHVIDSQPAHKALTFLLDNLPPSLHLIISTRADPPLPLSRWRSRGMMVEVHANDLRFTEQECAAYLNEAMGLGLPPEEIGALNRRTEGWIVGLQMAALALESKREPEDASAFVRAFSGSHHFVLDYLVEEVLGQQPEPVQSFLLQTSILSRLTGGLCSAVTGTGDGEARLEALDRANIFLVPLDEERRWYRYHHLFAEVLRARLQRTAGKQGLVRLHTRASEWYEGHGWIGQAFHHAVSAHDFERAGRLIEENWLRLGHAGEMNTVLRWLESIPDEVIRGRPMLSGAYAWMLWLTGRMDEVEPYLDAAGDAWEREAAAGTMEPEHVRWQAGGPALRTNLVRHRGQLQDAIRYAHQTLEMAVEDDALLHSYGHLGLAHAYRELGEYDHSLSAYLAGMPLARAAGNIAAANIAAFYLGRVLQLQGHLHRAAEAIREALQFTGAQGLGQSPASAILHFGLAGLLCEWNELDQARDHVERGQALDRLGGHHESRRNAGIEQARLRLAMGDPDGALEAIDAAEGVAVQAEMPLARAELAAHKARVWLALGDLAAASRWAEGAVQRPGEDRGYTRQLEMITFARVLLARGELEPALERLAVCQRAADESGGRGWSVEIGILQALAQEARGNAAHALAALESALLQAEPEGYVRVFATEGAAMAALLRRAVARGIAPSYAARLLESLNEQAPVASLVEPLTEREMEVLRLMSAGMSNREIAAELVVAMGTVKAHLHNIFGKLDVGSRVQAAARARELRLL